DEDRQHEDGEAEHERVDPGRGSRAGGDRLGGLPGPFVLEGQPHGGGRLLELVDRLLQSAGFFHHAPPSVRLALSCSALSCSVFAALAGRPRFFGAAAACASPAAAGTAGLRPRFFGAASAALPGVVLPGPALSAALSAAFAVAGAA